MRTQSEKNTEHSYHAAALFTLALRVVAGWTYFSAFWRRLILENKLDPDGAGYIGEKFNHFLPNALGIGPLIEYLVTHPQALWWFMLIFTIVEAVVGLLFMLGLFTRLMSIGVISLALGILLGAGWLGTTCLDEWQIGVLGIASGFTVFLSGGGRISLDHLLLQQNTKLVNTSWFNWLSSGVLPLSHVGLNRIVLMGSGIVIFLALFTNQYFHGGLWGKLHNLSIRPHISISDAKLTDESLSFTVFRDEGADVYGSFLIAVSLKNSSGAEIIHRGADDLAKMPITDISNEYVARVKPGAHSLVIPLGAKANLRFVDQAFNNLKEGTYQLKLTDVSGLVWHKEIVIK